MKTARRGLLKPNGGESHALRPKSTKEALAKKHKRTPKSVLKLPDLERVHCGSLESRIGRVRSRGDQRSQSVQRTTISGSGERNSRSLYLRYPLPYEHVSELLTERGLPVDASCIWRWVQACTPELLKRCRPYFKSTNKSYRVDETYIKVKGQEKYLNRAVDSTGQTIDFLLTAKRDAAAAKRFFQRVLSCSVNPIPGVINVDKNPAYPAAIRSLKKEGMLPGRVRLRQCKFLNNVIQQDHRTVKKRTRLARGYQTFHSASRTLEEIETVHMLRKGRVRWVAKNDVVAEARFIAKLIGLAA